MVEIGGKPILWHIMKIYSSHGINDFVICLGNKGYVIKEYFANCFLHSCDVTFDKKENKMEVHKADVEPWTVTLVETGDETQIGGRIKRVLPYLRNDDAFCLTYGDGVGNVDITKSIEQHCGSGLFATVTGTQPPGRFGALRHEGDQCGRLHRRDATAWEREPMEKLAADSQLGVYFHDGFWQPMDTLRDKNYLEGLWNSGKAPWKIWK
jgi:glucose-1-phosphate cytidylyltransferase